MPSSGYLAVVCVMFWCLFAATHPDPVSQNHKVPPVLAAAVSRARMGELRSAEMECLARRCPKE